MRQKSFLKDWDIKLNYSVKNEALIEIFLTYGVISVRFKLSVAKKIVFFMSLSDCFSNNDVKSCSVLMENSLPHGQNFLWKVSPSPGKIHPR